MLPGILRAAILFERAPRCGLPVTERSFGLDELLEAEAVFVTNSLRGLAPVTAIDATRLRESRAPRVAALVADLRDAFTP